MDKVDNSANRRIFSHDGPVVGLFAKQPVPGQVKTRLTPPLSFEQACRLYQTALQETVEKLQATGFAMALCYAGERGWFEQSFPGFPLLAQRGDGLGVRMANAVQELFSQGGGPVLLSGSDSPDLPGELVCEVVNRLEETDIVTVPCRDGGYAIIGLRRPTTDFFAQIPWSTERVQGATREECRRLGLSYHETGGWDDIDVLADLQRLVERSPASRTARHVVRELSELLC